MWLLQTLYNMIKVTPFLKNWNILWKFHERVTFPWVTLWRNKALKLFQRIFVIFIFDTQLSRHV